ncbi:glycosyltransferase [Pseudomonas sp. NBRC 111131]|uniref:glycosyltransferase n=1 Tax=Pseudomonas sp. NBRC 111131 TaxID=1661046 RepID=UPI000AD166A9|nr:glycosyltransferase [Pseudomonas sp. NBRC 111131]
MTIKKNLKNTTKAKEEIAVTSPPPLRSAGETVSTTGEPALSIEQVPATAAIVTTKKAPKVTEIASNPTKTFVEQLMRDRPDLTSDHIYRCLIDHNKYTEKYKDVLSSGMHAADHYFTFGHKESREFKRTGLIKHNQKFDIQHEAILFLSSAELRDGSFIYRCLLQSQQYQKNLVYSGRTEILKLVRAVFNCKELIFSRPEKNETAFYLIELAKNIGVKVTLDYDDLLLPEHAEYLGHVRSSDGTSIEEARKSLINKSSFLLYADAFRCSTPLIAKAMQHLSKPIDVYKNKILGKMVLPKQHCAARLSDINQRKIKLLYLSGTATHKKDFSIIQGPLLKLAQEFPDQFEITFLGNTGSNIGPISLYNSHVKIISRVEFSEMLKVISEHDLALAPLEDTIFNNAKSNIKFIECGSQGVPVLASPRDEFRSAISHNSNGWLCESQTDWYHQLRKLIKDRSQILRVSLKAREAVIKHFTLGEK